MKKTLWIISSLLVLSSMVLAACGSPEPAKETPVEEIVRMTDAEVQDFLPKIDGSKGGKEERCGESGYFSYYAELNAIAVGGTNLWLLDDQLFEPGRYFVPENFNTDRLICTEPPPEEEPSPKFLINEVTEEKFESKSSGSPQGLCHTTTWYPESGYLVVRSENEVALGDEGEAFVLGYYFVSATPELHTQDFTCFDQPKGLVEISREEWRQETKGVTGAMMLCGKQEALQPVYEYHEENNVLGVSIPVLYLDQELLPGYYRTPESFNPEAHTSCPPR